LYPDDAKSKNISLYSLHQFKLNRFLLHAGVRYSQYFLQMYDSTLGNVRIQPNALVLNLAASFQINLTNTLFANLGNGYRAPNIDDLGSLGVVDFRYELPSSSLSPEKSLHTELGYKLVTRKLHLQVSAFRMQLNDMIARVRINKDSINGYPVYRKDNIEKAYVHGAEIQLIYQVKSRLELGLNMTSTFGHNQTKNEPLRRIPPLFGQLFVKYKLAGFELQLTNQAAAKQDRLAQGDKEDNRIPKGGTPGWFISNVFLLKQIRSIQLQAAMYNLGNIDYRIHGSGINGQGRSIGLSLKYAIN
jgi:hemoglobin/transferrin/lactoferrin receptor protein